MTSVKAPSAMPRGPSIKAKKLAIRASVRLDPVRPNKAIAASNEMMPAMMFSTTANVRKR